MATYEITLRDDTLEQTVEADAYQQEGQMTTFFRTASGRTVVDTWSIRVASFKTSEILVIRRRDEPAPRMEPVLTGLRTA